MDENLTNQTSFRISGGMARFGRGSNPFEIRDRIPRFHENSMKTAVSLGHALRYRPLTNTHQMPMKTRNTAPANGVLTPPPSTRIWIHPTQPSSSQSQSPHPPPGTGRPCPFWSRGWGRPRASCRVGGGRFWDGGRVPVRWSGRVRCAAGMGACLCRVLPCQLHDDCFISL